MRTVLCRGCGLGRTDPLPEAAELAAFYRNHYLLLYKRACQPKPYRVLRNGRAARERFERLAGVLGPGSNILDAGCGGGEFLYLLRAAGCRATGVEPDTGCAAYAREELGLEVHAGLIGDQSFRPASFDGITLFHVLEHSPAPVETLSQLAAWLRPGGFLAVEVPNFESTLEHPGRRFHRAHLLHFSSETLTRCGQMAGLSLQRQQTTPDGGNLFHLFRAGTAGAVVPGPMPGVYRRLCRLELRRAAWRYWLAPRTYRRTCQRIWRMGAERLAARRYRTRRAILDSIASAMAGRHG